MDKKIISAASDLLKDKKVMTRIYLISLGAALLILVLIIKGPEEGGSLLADDNGNIIGIRRNSTETSERYDVRLKILNEDEISERDVTVTLRAVNDVPESREDTGRVVSREAEIDAEVDSMLSDIGVSDEKVIRLPTTLPDGTPVVWSPAKQKDRSGIALIPVIYLVLIALVIKSGLDTGKDQEAVVRREIMRGLPRFCNQLFLMMNAGLILSDAFEYICSSYMRIGDKNLGVFEKELTELCESNSEHRTSTSALLSEYAAFHNVKELVRIAAILTENEKRGSDVIENLSRESRFLWDERKIIAREQGRMIDSKMSWPLAMLLIILIVITMAPAMMNI